METRKYEPVEMPRQYLLEMFCDRIAASKVYMRDKYTDSYPLEYLLNKDKNARFHQNTRDQITLLLTLLAKKGEKETFRLIKKYRKDKELFNKIKITLE